MEQIQDITYSLCASPGFDRDGICFAARGSGLYRSDDAGQTWHFAYEALDLDAPLTTLAVAVSPNFGSDQAVFAGVPGGVLHSNDGGASWLIAMLPAPPPVVSSLVISPNYTEDGVLLAGTVEDGVFRSADRGGHWVAWNFGLLDLNILCTAVSPGFAADETLFAGTESGVFRSTNGGRAWREVNFPLEYGAVLSLALSPDYARDHTLFAGTDSHGLFWSRDAGLTWSRLGKVGAGSLRPDDAVNAILLSPQFPAQPHLMVALSAGLLISRDKGQSWTDWEPGLDLEQGVTTALAPLGLDPGAPVFLGMVEGGVLRV